MDPGDPEDPDEGGHEVWGRVWDNWGLRLEGIGFGDEDGNGDDDDMSGE